MARSVAVSVIMTRARRWANMERDTDFVSDAELLEYVDSAWTRLYALYAKAWPERFQTTQTVTTSSGTATYALPADYLGTISVDCQVGSVYYPLPLIEEYQRNDFQTGYSVNPAGYRVIGENLVVIPTPTATLSIRHTYLPTATPITSSATTIDGVLGHERLIELDVALRLKAKEEADTAALFAEYMRLREEVEEEATMRSVRTGQTIAITRDWIGLGRFDRGYYP